MFHLLCCHYYLLLFEDNHFISVLYLSAFLGKLIVIICRQQYYVCSHNWWHKYKFLPNCRGISGHNGKLWSTLASSITRPVDARLLAAGSDILFPNTICWPFVGSSEGVFWVLTKSSVILPWLLCIVLCILSPSPVFTDSIRVSLVSTSIRDLLSCLLIILTGLILLNSRYMTITIIRLYIINILSIVCMIILFLIAYNL